MSKLFTKTGNAVSFCEGCGEVCDRVCRTDAIRDQMRLQAFAYGWRQV